MQRRLPVYFLLDCSESMIGEGIQEVENGLNEFLGTLRRDPRCLESVWISVITFSSKAEQIIPLSELTDVNIPSLSVRPGTAMGEAYQLLTQCIEREVVKGSPQVKGDWRPLVFVITDGQPTDDFLKSKAAIETLTSPRVANVYAIGCGEDVDFGQLNEISDIVLSLDSLDPEGIRKLFVWLTASVQTASVEVQSKEVTTDGINLDKLPVELAKVDRNTPRRKDQRPRQVFVKAACSVKQGAYLMRYKLVPEAGYYQPVRSHPLDSQSQQSGQGFKLPAIPSDLLAGPAKCPYCGNEGGGVCSCGQIFCVGMPVPDEVECPGCHQIIPLSRASGSFDIEQSQG
ncbi:VWA domain-containing protein [bacterium]|nr:VWA domain-containing protein [bacterium]MDA7929638.1 VWA domain-containing protein [Akkermansiaceae bacterium]